MSRTLGYGSEQPCGKPHCPPCRPDRCQGRMLWSQTDFIGQRQSVKYVQGRGYVALPHGQSTRLFPSGPDSFVHGQGGMKMDHGQGQGVESQEQHWDEDREAVLAHLSQLAEEVVQEAIEEHVLSREKSPTPTPANPSLSSPPFPSDTDEALSAMAQASAATTPELDWRLLPAPPTSIPSSLPSPPPPTLIRLPYHRNLKLSAPNSWNPLVDKRTLTRAVLGDPCPLLVLSIPLLPFHPLFTGYAPNGEYIPDKIGEILGWYGLKNWYWFKGVGRVNVHDWESGREAIPTVVVCMRMITQCLVNTWYALLDLVIQVQLIWEIPATVEIIDSIDMMDNEAVLRSFYGPGLNVDSEEDEDEDEDDIDDDDVEYYPGEDVEYYNSLTN